MPTSQHLTIFLVKDGIVDPAEIVRDHPSRRISVLALSPQLRIDGELYLKRPLPTTPSWVPFVASGLANPASLADLRSSSLSAVALIRTSGRTFAISFGYGRTMLDPEMLEPRFGLFVVLNAVNPDLLRSVDARTLEELSLQTRRQASRATSIRTFELDLNRDLLRAVAGQPENRRFASRLAGSVPLAIEADVDFADLPKKCKEALRLSKKKTYRQRFPWVDHVQLVTDPAETAALDEALHAELTAENYGLLYLAAPEIIDYERIDYFRYSTSEEDAFDELDWDDYLSTLKRPPPTVTRLKRESVGAYYAGSAVPDHRWSIYRCLVVELSVGNAIYVLSAGDWFSVEKRFAKKTLDETESYERPPAPLPDANAGETEGKYNERACKSIGDDALLMDRTTFRATDGQDAIEFCDILLDGRIVHVKRKSASSTLSHLFMQGLVSGDLLQSDPGFRRLVSEDVTGRSSRFAGSIPESAIDTGNFEIVFAVIGKESRKGRHFLPFFSQVSFTRAARLLTQRGYRVALTRVPELSAIRDSNDSPSSA
jgi:uncharacterized protein (TIGR04141 family)